MRAKHPRLGGLILRLQDAPAHERAWIDGAELFVAGRRRTRLIEGLERQRALVTEALAETAAHIPVHACLCFLNPRGQLSGTDIPLLRTLEVGDIPLYIPRKLCRRLREPGVVDEAWTEHLVALLAQRFPSA